MRVVFVALAMALFFILFLPAMLILLIIRKFNRHLSSVISQFIVKYAFKVILFCAGVHVKVIGLENIPKGEPVLYAGNHRGFADVPLAYSTVPNITGFIAKTEIKKIPFMSWWMILVNCKFMDRNDMKQSLKIILQAIDDVKKGYSVFIMPEGTRGKNDDWCEPLPFKEGSMKIAEKTGCAIIPVAISNTSDVFEDHIPWVHGQHTVIHYGKPVYPKTMPKEDLRHLGGDVREIIIGMLKEDKQYCKNK
jgi:1-acyl-sn-glycerol-3-phosphate acyltransferase